ncbi:hypothetical protein [Streptomyces collinus]|uniref:Tetratricopeptide (TPR) repeat protein n=1 Tax=Streptomyces collinus TaxID=42684 RepID=A0AA89Q8P3_STRCU|nr:hypothetical protein [Streptomyces collinus]MBB5816332.1 tetratricopeptide (TPR) repeat protein [Streptomyces collinus]WMX69150.1 hypothetical protein RFN52_39915 [Streptomyces collinus]
MADVRGGTAAGQLSEGSGYLVAAELVLTARHVVMDPATDEPWERIDVRAGHPLHPPIERRTASVLWMPDEGADVALLLLDAPVAVSGVVRWGSVEGTRPLDYEGLGFPLHAVSYEDGERGIDQLWGVLPPLAPGPGMTWTLVQDNEAPRVPPDGQRAWAGVSGTAVFCGDLLVGVVVLDDVAHGNRRLYALPTRAFAAHLGFTELLERYGGGAPVLEPVDGRPPVPESGHLFEAREFTAARFEGRQRELAALDRFCTAPDGQESGYWRWMAPAWAGKTALMAQFVLHPPAHVDVLAYFVTTRQLQHSDRFAFLAAMGEQLRWYLKDADLDCTSRDRFLQALERAAQAAAQRGRKLLLAVDGLDEDTGVTSASTGYSIAALLPARPHPAARIVLATRPDPPVPSDVPEGHPLHGEEIDHWLEGSPAAGAVRRDAERSLAALLDGGGLGEEVARLTAAAGGGLSATDLAHLTRTAPGRVRQVLGGSVGRSFQRRASRNAADGSPAEALYFFGHRQLQDSALELLSPDELGHYRKRVRDFVKVWRKAGWPSDTPEYALVGYPMLMRTLGDAVRLGRLAIDAARHERLWHATGSDAAALAEIDDAFRLLLSSPRPDLKTAVRLSHRRDVLLRHTGNLPEGIVTLWVALGRTDRAVALARAHPDPVRRVEQLIAIGDTLLEGAEVTTGRDVVVEAAARAQTVTLFSVKDQVRMLTRVARMLARVGEDPTVPLRTAVGLAETITDPGRQSEKFVHLHDGAGPQFEALHLSAAALAEASEACRTGAHTAFTAFAEELADRTEKLADQAARMVRTMYPGSQPGHFVSVARTMARTGRHHRAVELAEAARAMSFRDPGVQGEHLARIAQALAEAGQAERAAAQCQKAAELVRQVPDTTRQAGHLVAVAQCMLATADVPLAHGRRSGERQRCAAHLALEAAALVTGGTDAPDDVLRDVAEVLTSVGRPWEAAEIGRTLTRPQNRIRTLLSAARALADSGEPGNAAALAHDAARTARSLDDVAAKIAWLASAGGVLARTGNRHDASNLSNESSELARVGVKDRPSALTLAWLIDALSRIGTLKRAARLAESLADPAARSDALALTARAYAQAGDLQTATRLTAQSTELTRRGSEAGMDLNLRANAWAEVALALATAGDLRGAADVARDVTTLGDTGFGSMQQPLAGVVQALARAGRTDEAFDLAETLTDTETKADAVARMALALSEAGDIQGAWDLATQAAFLALDPIDPLGTALAIERIVRTLAQSGSKDVFGTEPCLLAHRALDVALTATEPLSDPRILAYITQALIEAGDVRHGVELVALLTDDTDDPEDQAVALSYAAHALALAGRIESAEYWSERAVEQAGDLTGSEAQADVVFNAFRVQLMAGQPLRATTLARTIPDLGLRATALTQASGALLSAGELQAAADAAWSIPDPAERVNALAGMASTLSATGQHSEAAGHLANAAAQARTLADSDRRAEALARVAHAADDEAAGHALLCEALSVGTWTQTLRVIPEVAPELLKTVSALLMDDG